MRHHECPQCQRIKPLDAFYATLGACRECKRIRMKSYRRKKREKLQDISERAEYIPLPCEIAFRCSEIRNNWSPRMERLRSGFTEHPLEVEFVAIGGMRRKVFR